MNIHLTSDLASPGVRASFNWILHSIRSIKTSDSLAFLCLRMDPADIQPCATTMQFRQLTQFCQPHSTTDKPSSSAHTRSAGGTWVYPHFSRQNSSQQLGPSIAANITQSSFAPVPQHDLYPAPPGHARQSGYSNTPPQSWPTYEQRLAMSMASGIPVSYDSFPTASPYPPPRLSPPSSSSLSLASYASRQGSLAGSLDPTTGVFYRTPDHPRLRTAQACEKCRTRKAKVYFH